MGRSGGAWGAVAGAALTPVGFGPCEMKTLLDKHEDTDCVSLETGASERNGVPPT
jgi:hypothetical protein